MEAALGYQVDDLAEPKDRDRDPDQGKDHQERVEDGAPEDRGGNPEENAEDDPDDGRSEHERQGHRRRTRDLGDHPGVAAVGDQVARDEHVLHHQPVANGQRTVEPELVLDALDRFGRRVSTGHLASGVDTRRGKEDQEHKHRDREQNEGHPEKTADDEGKHSVPLPVTLLSFGVH